ncbi:MAG: hypothetical protein JXR03_00185 [Cyclobacteriaceae bacterium]
MEQIGFIAIRKNGRNFGKPIAVDKVLDEFKTAELLELDLNDSIRFYSESGENIDSKIAFELLNDFRAYTELDKCSTKQDYDQFILKYKDSKLAKVAKEKIEELIIQSATTDDDYKNFLMRFPKSKFAHIAREKLPDGFRKRVIVISSLEQIDTNDRVIEELRNQNQSNVFSGILDRDSMRSLEAHVIENDVILAIVDDNYYVELFTLFALCLKHKRDVIPVYPHNLPLQKITNSELTSQLIKAQSASTDQSYSEIIREIRVDLDGYFKKMGTFKSLKTDQLEKLKSLIS